MQTTKTKHFGHIFPLVSQKVFCEENGICYNLNLLAYLSKSEKECEIAKKQHLGSIFDENFRFLVYRFLNI